MRPGWRPVWATLDVTTPPGIDSLGYIVPSKEAQTDYQPCSGLFHFVIIALTDVCIGLVLPVHNYLQSRM